MEPRRVRTLGWIIVLGVLAAAAAVVGYQLLTWPDVAALARANPETTAFIERYRAQRRAAGQSDRVEWRWIPDQALSPHLKRAAVSAEDMEFFSHDGFSTSEIKLALREALETKEAPRGASTITQQLAKNLWLSPSRNPIRKFKEVLLTRQLERKLAKRRILEIYLNVVEFGSGVYGAEAAAQRYFGKSAASLTEHEAAQLAASLPRPSRWHPGVESPAYWSYVEDIEERMARATFLWRHVGGAQAAPAVTDSL
jgi:monofunctional biosynthetic peptidoglycan transglycosylase